MKKKIFTALAAATVWGMVCSPVYAGIDESVFENKGEYKVEWSSSGEEGLITITDGSFLGGFVKDKEDEGTIYGSIDIKILGNGDIAAPRLSLIYYGEDWISTEQVIVRTSDHSYTFDVDTTTDTSDGKIYEMCTLVLTDESIQLLEDVAKNTRAAMDVCFLGDREVNGCIVFVKENMEKLYEDYVEAGGLDQDLSIIHEFFPCTVEDLNKDSGNTASTEESTETTLEEALENVNTKVSEWNESDDQTYRYIPMKANEGYYNIILLIQDDTDLTETAIESDVKEVYQELKKCLRGHDISVGIIVAKSAEEIVVMYSEEELAALL